MIPTTKGGKETEIKNDSTLVSESQVCVLVQLWGIEGHQCLGPCSINAADKRFQMIFKIPPTL